MVGTTSDLLGGDASSSASPTMVNMPPKTSKEEGASDNIANALNSQPPATNNNNNSSGSDRWGSMMGGMAGSLVNSARGVVSTAAASVSKQASDISSSGGNNSETGSNSTTSVTGRYNSNNKATATPPSSGNAFFATLTSVSSAATNSSLVRGITQNITGKNTLPDKTTASQVLMFRQLLHTKCRPGLRLSRKYEGTAAQKAVLHMPWWERGIETSMKMIISYDNLITRLWLSGAIMPFERGGYGCCNDNVVLPITNSPGSNSSSPPGAAGSIDTLVNERGLPPIPHNYWVDRLGFQQDDPVTDFRSGGVLSLAMLVHIVESCPSVHSRFVPKPKADTSATSSYISTDIISLEEIITDDASVLPFGITCINITDMLAKFLMFSKAVDKMDALLSAKPFWRMFIDPNAMLVLQEVSLDLLCDVCVEIGRERRIEKLKKQQEGNSDGSSLDDNSKKMKKGGGMPGSGEGKVTVFDFSEIIERTEKRVGEEVLGAGPQNVDELRAVARKVKSKYLMRIQLKEKHLTPATSPLSKQIPPLPSAESVKNVMGNFAGLLKRTDSAAAAKGGGLSADESGSDVIDFSSEKEPTPRQEVEVHIDGTTSTPDDDLFASASNSVPEPATATSSAAIDATPATTKDEATTTAAEDEGFDELDKLSAELGELSAVTSEAFDLLGDDFDMADIDAMDTKVDAFAAFAIDDEDEDFLS